MGGIGVGRGVGGGNPLVQLLTGGRMLSIQDVVFLSCPLVKKHADLFGSFLY